MTNELPLFEVVLVGVGPTFQNIFVRAADERLARMTVQILVKEEWKVRKVMPTEATAETG